MKAQWMLWRVMNECPVRVRPVFAWFDCWVGVYVDQSRPRIYILPVPMVGVVIDWPDADPELYRVGP